jgi:hypothetical protein
MKNNQTLAVVASILVLTIVGYFGFMQLGPKKITKLQPAKVEQITSIDAGYNTSALDSLGDQTKVKDFYAKPDLTTGLGVGDLFAPLK